MPTPLILSACPYWVEPHVAEIKSLVLHDKEYEYLVLRPSYTERNGGPETFVTKTPTGVLAVSESYGLKHPEVYQELGIMHEIIASQNREDPYARCVALEQELDTVGRHNLPQDVYIRFRRDYFAGQIAYYQRCRPHRPDVNLVQLCHARALLAGAFHP